MGWVGGGGAAGRGGGKHECRWQCSRSLLLAADAGLHGRVRLPAYMLARLYAPRWWAVPYAPPPFRLTVTNIVEAAIVQQQRLESAHSLHWRLSVGALRRQQERWREWGASRH